MDQVEALKLAITGEKVCRTEFADIEGFEEYYVHYDWDDARFKYEDGSAYDPYDGDCCGEWQIFSESKVDTV